MIILSVFGSHKIMQIVIVESRFLIEKSEICLNP
jgi:hypothetical protein